MYQVILVLASLGTCSNHKSEKKGSFVEWILRTCLKNRLRSNHRWVLTTLTYFTNRNQSCAAEIRRTQDIIKELEMDFIFIEADQAIYTKVLDVMFASKNTGEDIFLP